MRKRYYYAAAAMVLALALAGCGKDNHKETDSTGEQESVSAEETEENSTDTSDEGESVVEDSGENTEISALHILETVWVAYDDEERFAAMGGDYENSVMDAPGTFDYTNKENLETMLLVPQKNAEMIDEAASLMHMMNANTFTSGAYHIGDKENVQTFADDLQVSIQGTQWMCGFPEKLLIVSIDEEYVVAAFGKTEPMDYFKERLSDKFQSMDILYDEAIED